MVAMKFMANTRLPSAVEGDTPAACASALIVRVPGAATKSLPLPRPRPCLWSPCPPDHGQIGRRRWVQVTQDKVAALLSKGVAMAAPIPPEAPVMISDCAWFPLQTQLPVTGLWRMPFNTKKKAAMASSAALEGGGAWAIVNAASFNAA